MRWQRTSRIQRVGIGSEGCSLRTTQKSRSWQKIAEEARVKRLALTHLLSVAGEIVLVGTGKEHYSGEVFAAQVGESLEI